MDYATTELKDRMGEDLRPRGGTEEITEDTGVAREEEGAGVLSLLALLALLVRECKC